MKNYSVGYITFKNSVQARKICETLLKEKLIACANILPAHTAIYEWKGKPVRSKETAAIIKTTSRLEKRLARRVKEIHSYEVPCVVFWGFHTPLTAFTQWISAQTRPSNLTRTSTKK